MANIPNLPGVPRLSSYSAFPVILAAVDVLLPFPLFTSVWGIFRSGIAVIAADNTISFDLRQDFSISNYPQEKGAFQSYNKVQLPTDLRVTVSCGGSMARRQNFLRSIDAVMNTTDLYDVVTPERTYIGYNFSHRDLRRTSRNGVGLISVDLWLTQINESSSATFQNTQTPGVAGAQGNGNVQPMSGAASAAPYVQQQLSTGAWKVQ